MNVKCNQCEIAHNCDFCPNCGSPALPHPQGPAGNQRKKTSLSSGLKLVGSSIVVIVILFLIGMAGLLSSANDETVAKQSEFQLVTGVSAEQEEDILKVLKDCGVEVNSIEHDEWLDDMNKEGETGYRVSTEDVNNVILYLNSDKTVNIVRYANNDLYKDGAVLSSINNYYVSYSEKLDLKSSSEKVIKEILKSPSTAKFPSLSKWSMWKEDGLTYIQGYVDAQNSFGAELRSEFQFILDGNTVISLVFDGEEYILYPEQNSAALDSPLETVSHSGPSITPAPALPTSSPMPEPTKAPTSTPEPEKDYSDWVLYDTDDLDLLYQNIIVGHVISDGNNFLCSPEYYEMIKDEVIIYEYDVSEYEYYDYVDYSVLDPHDAASLAERNYLDNFDGDVEFVIIEEPKDEYNEEALYERINDILENNKASSGDD